ncbi:MAG: tetratricopeptide repeat protein [Thermoguttaceae bacterium]|nr:tetratricopeptide repeat protein [Thermoguttaceae bacterium]MDW8038942.1 tetratricopeptide repeat protein [Thermoguttaceae bacterium]
MNFRSQGIWKLSGPLVGFSSAQIVWLWLMASAGGQWSAQSPVQARLCPRLEPLGSMIDSVPSGIVPQLSSEVPEAPEVRSISAPEHVLSDQGREPEIIPPHRPPSNFDILPSEEGVHGPVIPPAAEVAPKESGPVWTPFVPARPVPIHYAAQEERQPDVGSSWLPVRQGEETIDNFSPQPWARPVLAQERSILLERMARQAQEHIRRAFELGGRGAYFSARAEFITALHLLAEGLDQQHRTQQHSLALAQGLTTLQEADDFLGGSNGVGQIRDLWAIVNSHETPVLRQTQSDRLTPMEALQRYFTYAQEQLALAVGQEVAGSMALYGLGKLYTAMAEQPALGVKAAQAKAMVFYQAALLVDPTNYRAANDLGVLLARGGWFEEARAALVYSLQIHSHPIGWRNLAMVYRQMGQYELALQAARHWQLLRHQGSAQDQLQTVDLVVQWMPPEQFAATTGNHPDAPLSASGYLGPVDSQYRASSAGPPAQRGPLSDFRESGATNRNSQSRANSAQTTSNQNKPILFWKSLLAEPLASFLQANTSASRSKSFPTNSFPSQPSPPRATRSPMVSSGSGPFR